MHVKIELHAILSDMPDLGQWARRRAQESFHDHGAVRPEVAMVTRRLWEVKGSNPPFDLADGSYGLITFAPLLDEGEAFDDELRAKFFDGARVLAENVRAVSVALSVECWIAISAEPLRSAEDHPQAEECAMVSLEQPGTSAAVWMAPICRDASGPQLGDFREDRAWLRSGEAGFWSGRMFGLLQPV